MAKSKKWMQFITHVYWMNDFFLVLLICVQELQSSQKHSITNQVLAIKSVRCAIQLLFFSYCGPNFSCFSPTSNLDGSVKFEFHSTIERCHDWIPYHSGVSMPASQIFAILLQLQILHKKICPTSSRLYFLGSQKVIQSCISLRFWSNIGVANSRVLCAIAKG